MAKVKIHELAKDLDKNSKDIINLLEKKGIVSVVALMGI